MLIYFWDTTLDFESHAILIGRFLLSHKLTNHAETGRREGFKQQNFRESLLISIKTGNPLRGLVEKVGGTVFRAWFAMANPHLPITSCGT
jgi:hypothetical protein